MIRLNANWTEIPHERILEYLRDYGPASTSIMAQSKGLEGSEEIISKRCEKLESEGLITLINERTFTITELGEAYLDGDLDLEEQSSKKYIFIRLKAEKHFNCEGNKIYEHLRERISRRRNNHIQASLQESLNQSN